MCEPARWKARGDKNSCLSRRFIGVDFDLDFGVHAAGGIRLEDAIRAIERFPTRPAAVVSSGGGLHVYYLLEGKADKAAIEWVGDRVNGFFARAICPANTDLWDTKPTVDIARILRIPGTFNRKEQFRSGAAPVPVRLVHTDESAAPLTRMMAEVMPTFAEVKRAALGTPRPRRDVPTVVRVHGGTPPWEAFNVYFNTEHALGDLIERLGGSVSGGHAFLPGDPGWEEPNTAFSGRITQGEQDMLVTIFEPSVANFWSNGQDRPRFSAFDLLAHTFGGDRSATARYVKRVVLDDIGEWLAGFSWAPGDTAPADAGRPRASKSVVVTDDFGSCVAPPADDPDDFEVYAVPALGDSAAGEVAEPPAFGVESEPAIYVPLPPVFESNAPVPDRTDGICPYCDVPLTRTATDAWLCDVCEDF